MDGLTIICGLIITGAFCGVMWWIYNGTSDNNDDEPPLGFC